MAENVPPAILPNGAAAAASLSAASDNLKAASHEIAKLNNIPAINGGDRFLTALRELRTNINTDLQAQISNIRDELRNEIRTQTSNLRDEVRDEIRTLRVAIQDQIAYSNANQAARLENSNVSTDSEAISPLVHPRTGEAFTQFPGYTRNLRNMTDAALNTLLTEMELQINGNRITREKRFKKFVGLKTL